MTKSPSYGKVAGLLLAFILAFVFVVAPARAAIVGIGNGANYFTTLGDAWSTIYYNSGYVAIGGNASARATLYIQALTGAGAATSTLQTANSSGVTTFDVSQTGTTTIRQYVGFGTPTVATSTGAGSANGTSTLATGSTDLAGAVYLSTAATPAANATIFTLTSASSSNPWCVVSPMSQTAALLQNASSTFVATTSNGFSLKSGTVGLAPLTTYQWAYHCN